MLWPVNGEPPDRRIGVSFSGQVVLVTGAARGQGRSHALRFAQGGAAIVAVDLCAQIPSVVGYPMATRADLEETVRLVRKLGAPVWATVADVRDADGMRAVARSAVAEFGGIDVVIANAGISSYGRATELGEQAWRDVVDTNLTGVMNTIDAALASMRSRGRASVVTTSSLAGMRGAPFMIHYVVSKHGVVGLTRRLAADLAPWGIRVNSVLPGAVDAPPGRLSGSQPSYLADRTFHRFFEPVLPIGLIDPGDVSDAVCWLASSHCPLNGACLTVDGGATLH